MVSWILSGVGQRSVIYKAARNLSDFTYLQVLHSWNELRTEFQTCNARKAIAPTQFNPMSTRGHCIMVLEVEMPGEVEVTNI